MKNNGENDEDDDHGGYPGPWDIAQYYNLNLRDLARNSKIYITKLNLMQVGIASDPNVFFIETILKHHSLFDCFSKINTNSSVVDKQGRLRIFPCHDLTSSSCFRNLDNCPPNMCKGRIIERIKAKDGKGDYCPMLRLRKEYFVMPRKDYPLWELICCDPSKIKAKIFEWSVGEELERTLLDLVRLINFFENHINFFEDHNVDFNNADAVLSTALDCKFQLVALRHRRRLPSRSFEGKETLLELEEDLQGVEREFGVAESRYRLPQELLEGVQAMEQRAERGDEVEGGDGLNEKEKEVTSLKEKEKEGRLEGRRRGCMNCPPRDTDRSALRTQVIGSIRGSCTIFSTFGGMALKTIIPSGIKVRERINEPQRKALAFFLLTILLPESLSTTA
ncbi:hypothetical protein Scep_020021 [Stephania cephalantha]|uniref:Uncharacterized protein n=1 Tax=Stephania cephalantha TaxID=152367 RepID=A0AAP0ICD8_9MAGN